MKYLILFLTVSNSAFSFIVSENTTEFGERFFYFPGDGDGVLHLVDTQEEADENVVENISRDSIYYEFWLFTRNNPTTPYYLMMGYNESVTNSTFDFSRNTVILVHGWNGNGGNEMNRLLTEAFLNNSDANVIVLDWGNLANKNYITAKKGVPKMGQILGQFVNWLTNLGTSFERMHLIGFSLGAHLVGNAGRENGGRVKRITALDPAGPLWRQDKSRILQTDAEYVEVIHTNSGIYGLNENCGHVDFYPNGGASMPGCWMNSCSHGKAYEYMAASVLHDSFFAHECDSLRDATKDNCNGDLYKMGNSDLTKSRSGIFRVNTGKIFPFMA